MPHRRQPGHRPGYRRRVTCSLRDPQLQRQGLLSHRACLRYAAGPVSVGSTWPAFTVRIEDEAGSLVTSATTDVTVSLGSGVGVLSGTLTRPAVGGIATFDDLSFNQVGAITIDVAASGLIGISGTPIEVREAITAIPVLSVWRYDDTGTDLGTAWRDPAFVDSGWATGAGILGYGEPFIDTIISFGADPSNKHHQLLFRKSFAVTEDPADIAALKLNINYDDGFVAYLNGQEVAARSMPSGAILFSTPAISHEGGAYETVDLVQSLGLLVQGTNVLAIELHQFNATSSDLVFDTSLVYEAALPAVNSQPQITSAAVTAAAAGVLYTYDAEATDINGGQVLTWSLDVFAAGMTIDSVTGVISWTPTAGQVSPSR